MVSRNKCKTCKHGLFNTQWGEYRCIKKKRRVSPDKELSCRDYSRKTGPVKETGGNEDD